MMKNKRRWKLVLWILLIICGLGVVGYAGALLYAGHTYNSYIEQLPPALRPVEEGDRLKTLRQEVREGEWRMVGRSDGESSETDMSDTIAALGYPLDMDGVIALYCYQLPEFDYLDVGAMEGPVAMAYLRSILMPNSDDGTLYINDARTVAVIFVKDGAVVYVRVVDGKLMTGALISVDKLSADKSEAGATDVTLSVDDLPKVSFEL